MPKIKQPSEFSDSNRWSLLNYSTHDYIASRTLLLNNQAGPGTIMAITAMEKLLKTLLLMLNEAIDVGGTGHRLEPMIDRIKAIDPSFINIDQEIFLKHIDKAYKIRYPDKVDPSFRIFLPSLKILEYLDMTYCQLIEKSPLNSISPGGRMLDMYLNGSMGKDKLCNCNSYYNPSLRGELYKRRQMCTSYSEKDNSYIEWYKPSESVKPGNDWSEPNNFNT